MSVSLFVCLFVRFARFLLMLTLSSPSTSSSTRNEVKQLLCRHCGRKEAPSNVLVCLCLYACVCIRVCVIVNASGVSSAKTSRVPRKVGNNYGNSPRRTLIK